MYAVAKLSSDSAAFIQGLTQYAGQPELVNLALARAIAQQLPLPATEQELPSDHFLHEVSTQARSTVSALTEVLSVDTTTLSEQVRTLWLVRYRTLYPTCSVYERHTVPSESTFLGYGSEIEDATISLIQANSLVLCRLLNGFNALLCDLCETTSVEEPVTADSTVA